MNLLPSELSSGLSLVLVGVFAVAWFLYFEAKDPRRARRNWHRAIAIAGGVGSAATALILFDLLSALGLDVQWARLAHGTTGEAVSAALTIGAVEELSKMLSVAVVAAVTGRVRNRFEGLLCAACAGIGFASAETVVHLSAGGMSSVQMLARVTASPLTHAVFAVPWGIGLAALAREGRWDVAIGGFLVSVASHALYDFFVGRVSSYASAAVVLALWLGVIHQAPVLLDALRRPIRRARTITQPQLTSAE